ncbi:putative zinc finger protein [Orchesella cincta]|uniref:Putative zinc finger protein n=1 Tax=Orchesella cincta TaxID=48709 RepID=A0A1D2MD70_ORCCI|nr:putative zinc finger protein [Orchesella cincta]
MLQPSCGKVFTIQSQLQKHTLTHKAPLERPHRFCHLCNSTRAFLTNHGFRRHLRIHHSATPAYQCNFCRKLFESEEMLLEHVRESGHNKEKEFSCVICRQHFSLRKCLQKHLKTNSHIVKESLYKITVNNKEMLKDLVKKPDVLDCILSLQKV